MNEITLAIESAVGGGSLALIVDGKTVDAWHGGGQRSRSEELLAEIAQMLDRADVERSRLSRIAVSNGPGSYTGIRIGLATAMGLGQALSVPCVGIFLLNALELMGHSVGERIVIVPMGRSGFCWKYTGPGASAASGSVFSGSLEELVKFACAYPNAHMAAQTDAFNAIANAAKMPASSNVIDLGRGLAEAVGFASTSMNDGLEPFYIRDTPPKASMEI